jgi:hypothetical protein
MQGKQQQDMCASLRRTTCRMLSAACICGCVIVLIDNANAFCNYVPASLT